MKNPLEEEFQALHSLVAQLQSENKKLKSTIEVKEKEIERLKGLIERIYYGMSLPDDYEQFKIENNL